MNLSRGAYVARIAWDWHCWRVERREAVLAAAEWRRRWRRACRRSWQAPARRIEA